jgi:hypothetical protein
MFHDCRHGLAAPFAHHHNAAAFSVLAFAPTPINPRGAMIFRANMAAKPTAVYLNDPAQNGRHCRPP